MLDVDERIAHRQHQTMQLARYGHVGKADQYLGWGDVQVAEIDALYHQLALILKEEGPAGAAEQ